MKCIITADVKKSWTIDNLETSYAFVTENKNEANLRWKRMKENNYFTKIYTTTTTEKVKEHELTLYQIKQGEKPTFATAKFSEDVFRLYTQIYGTCDLDTTKYIIPDRKLEDIEFETIEHYNYKGTNEEDYDNVEIVREKTFKQKFFLATKFVRYDEMLTGREDVCEMTLHPYCSDFNLVKDIVFEEYDYDL